MAQACGLYNVLMGQSPMKMTGQFETIVNISKGQIEGKTTTLGLR
jgi:hypothetical protein